MNADVVIAGGGVIGTAIAWRAARRGLSTILVDPGRGDAASLVAAGMLGPVTESVFGEQDLLSLNLLAIGRFPDFSEELEAETGRATGLRTEGTLAVAYDSDDFAALRRLTAFRHSIGLKADELDGRACRQLEPFLAPGVHGGVLATGDLSVDNRRYLAALREAARAAGVRTIAGAVTEVQYGEGRPRVVIQRAGPNVADGPSSALEGGQRPIGHVGGGPADVSGAPADVDARPAEVDGGPAGVISARDVVLAAGWATSRIGGLPDPVRKAIRPVKGQILRLRHPAGIPPVITRTVRALVQGRDVYIVPRADGEVVVGATQEERDDTIITAGAVHDLLRDAMTAVPALSELVLAETSAGLRPGTQDNGPVVGRLSDGLIVAAGHFRNGILLSAATAEAVAAILAGAEPPREWVPFSPGRFA